MQTTCSKTTSFPTLRGQTMMRLSSRAVRTLVMPGMPPAAMRRLMTQGLPSAMARRAEDVAAEDTANKLAAGSRRRRR